MLAIWEQKFNKEKMQKLPLIIPLVFYHGESRWNIANNFSSLIEGIEDLPLAVRKYLPDYKYLLYDLSNGEEEIKGELLTRIYLETLKNFIKM